MRVDGPDVLREGVAVQLIASGGGARGSGRRIDDDPVVLLSAEDVCVASTVLVHASAVRKVELHCSRGHLSRRARSVRVTGVRRDLAIVLISHVSARIRRVLEGQGGILLRREGGGGAAL